MVKVEEALRQLTPNDVIVLHLYNNIAYMARSELGGDLPIRQYINGEFHVEGDLVIASKDRLFMYFKNTLPLLRMLDGRRVVFLIPLLARSLQDAVIWRTMPPTAPIPDSRPTSGLASLRSDVFSRTSYFPATYVASSC